MTDEEKLNVACALTEMCKGFSFLCDIVLHHNPLDGNDWSDVLINSTHFNIFVY